MDTTRLPLLALLLVLGGVAPLYGQARIDSLEARLPRVRGAERLAVVVELLRAHQATDPEQALAYGREALALLRRYPDPQREAKVWYWKAFAHDKVSQYDSVLAHAGRLRALAESTEQAQGLADAAYLEGLAHWRQGAYERAIAASSDALARYEALQDRRGTAAALNDIGLAYWRQGQYEQARGYFERSLSLKEALGDSSGVAWALNNIGLIHWNLGQFEAALDHHLRALTLREKLGGDDGVAAALNNIGLVYQSLGDYEEALGFFERVLEIAERLNNRRGIALTLNNIGQMHEAQGDPEAAISYYERSLALKEEIGDEEGAAWTVSNIGTVYQNQGRFEDARSMYRQALARWKRLGGREGIATTLHHIGRLAMEQGDYAEALSATQEALAIGQEIGAQVQVGDGYEQLADLYERMGRYDEALGAYKRFKAAHDSLYDTESQSVVAELQEQYRAKEQQQRIELLQREREIQRLWVAGLGGGALLLLLVAGLLYSRYRLKSRSHTLLSDAHEELQWSHEQLKTTQQQLLHAEKMASLGALTAGIAHEIKNPLNFVNNFSQLTGELVEELDEVLQTHRQALSEDAAAEVDGLLADVRLNAAKIEEHGRRADGIVHAMMLHARGTEGERDAVDLNGLVEEYVGLAYHGMRAQVPDFNVEVERDYSEAVGTVELVPQEIGRVLLNLLHNAFYAVYRRQARVDGAYQPRVTVCTLRTGKTVEVRIGDNGPGIPEDLRQKIFEPFFTTKPTGEGTGLGLSLSYDIVTQGHGGRMTVESKEGEGATFYVVLPVDSTAS